MDFNRTEKTVYEEFKWEIGSATVQRIARKNSEAIKEKAEWRIPHWLKPKPSNIDFYWLRGIAEYQSNLNSLE